MAHSASAVWQFELLSPKPTRDSCPANFSGYVGHREDGDCATSHGGKLVSAEAREIARRSREALRGLPADRKLAQSEKPIISTLLSAP